LAQVYNLFRNRILFEKLYGNSIKVNYTIKLTTKVVYKLKPIK
jgi:hypothetical protein